MEGHQTAERVIQESGIHVAHVRSDRAFYNLQTDKVTLPEREPFASANGYYQTALHELVNKPGRTPWDGATGSGLNWRLATSELEAERRHLRLDGEPVILYSLLSPPARATSLLNDLYRLDSVMTVTLEWRQWDLDAARSATTFQSLGKSKSHF